jgi:hypothetical protein
MKVNIKICVITLFFWVLLSAISFAVGNINLSSNKIQILPEEEFEISIDLEDVPTVAFQLELYFDKNIVEYVSGPENSNEVDNRIIHVWVDETGGIRPKQNGSIANFKFKAKKVGEPIFRVNGTFYDIDENVIPVLFAPIMISVNDKVIEKVEPVQDVNVSSDNDNLKVMRMGVEGINPNFDKNVTQYNIVVSQYTNNLDITAVAENPESTVNIYGNSNFKNGLNKVTIEVISKDKSRTKNYIIDVTKTGEPQKANSNLETLAIEYFSLYPSFSPEITGYKVEVPSDTENINVFAVPESSLARTEIVKQDILNYGNNDVNVIVTAENGITKKNYNIKVYRRTAEEDILKIEEQEEKVQRLSQIIEEQGIEKISNEQEENKSKRTNSKNKQISVEIMLSVLLAAVILGIIIRYKATKRQKIII